MRTSKLICISMGFFASLFSVVFAQEFDFKGKIITEIGAGLPYTNDNAGKLLLGKTFLETELNHYADESSMYFDGSITFDGLHSQSSNNSLEYIAGDDSICLKIKEAWFDYNGGWWSFRIGRQITSWGKADDIQVTDILCPKDNTNLIASSYSDSRLGIDALRLSYNGNSFVADIYWISFFTPSALPFSNRNPLKKIEFPEEEDGMKINYEIELPELKLQNGEYAARLCAYLPFADLSLYGFYGWDDLPVQKYTMSDSNLSVSGEYFHLGMAGADAAIPISQVLLRLEAAFYPQRYFSTNVEKQLADERETIQRNQLVALAGIDWNPSGFTITAQYYADTVFGDIDLIDRQIYEHQATLSIERSFLNDTLRFSLIGALGLNDFDSFAEFEVNYSITDQVKLSVIGDLYNKGKDNGEFGKYKDLSCVTLKGEYRF